MLFFTLALAECLTPEDAARGQVFPHISKIRLVSRAVAVAVMEEAIRTDLNTKVMPENDNLLAYVNQKMYYPEYVPLVEKRIISM
jgi:malic enzyme